MQGPPLSRSGSSRASSVSSASEEGTIQISERISRSTVFVNPQSDRFCPQFHVLGTHEKTKRVRATVNKRILFFVETPAPEAGKTVLHKPRGITDVMKKTMVKDYNWSAHGKEDPQTKMLVSTLVARSDQWKRKLAAAIQKELSANPETLQNSTNRVSSSLAGFLFNALRTSELHETRIRQRIKQSGKNKVGKMFDSDKKVYDAILANDKAMNAYSQRHAQLIGLNRGKEVHTQIEYYVNYGPADFFRKYPVPMPHVKQIILQLVQHELTPICSEFPIYYESMFIGTSIDMLCRDKLGRLVVVEIKTGSIKAMSAHHGHLQEPFEKVTDCRLWQAVLQVMFAAEVIRHEYNVKFCACKVIVADRDTSFTLDVQQDARWYRGNRPILSILDKAGSGIAGAAAKHVKKNTDAAEKATSRSMSPESIKKRLARRAPPSSSSANGPKSMDIDSDSEEDTRPLMMGGYEMRSVARMLFDAAERRNDAVDESEELYQNLMSANSIRGDDVSSTRSGPSRAASLLGRARMKASPIPMSVVSI